MFIKSFLYESKTESVFLSRFVGKLECSSVGDLGVSTAVSSTFRQIFLQRLRHVIYDLLGKLGHENIRMCFRQFPDPIST